jgi:ATP-dependent Clp protease protease subunit
VLGAEAVPAGMRVASPPVATKARASRTQAFISFSSPLNVKSTESLIEAATELAGENIGTVVLCLSCFGGNFDRAVSLYNTLRAMPFKLVTHNVANVGSAANVLFLAGERRFACPQAVFFLHPSSASLDGSFHPSELAKHRAELLASDAREREIIEQRTSLSARQIKALVDRSSTIDAERALAAGIIHAVKDLQIPSGARVVKA